MRDVEVFEAARLLLVGRGILLAMLLFRRGLRTKLWGTWIKNS